MIECAQKAISRPVSRVSPKPRFDRNHCLLSSTKLTRQMGTFNAVPQSAVMRSNSWWRGVSSLRAVWDGWPGARRGRLSRPSSVDATGAPARRRRAYASSVCRRGLRGVSGGAAPFHNGTLVSYSSKERSVDMRSSSSSGRGQDIYVPSEPWPSCRCSAPRRRVCACAGLGYAIGEVGHAVTTFEARQGAHAGV